MPGHFWRRLAIVDYIMPGFQLAKAAADIYDANPDVEGLLLQNHGHFAFGESAKQSYERIIEHTNMVARYFGMDHPTSLAVRQMPPDIDRIAVLRGVLGEAQGGIDDPMPILDLRNGPDVKSFLQRPDIADLSHVVSPLRITSSEQNRRCCGFQGGSGMKVERALIKLSPAISGDTRVF